MVFHYANHAILPPTPHGCVRYWRHIAPAASGFTQVCHVFEISTLLDLNPNHSKDSDPIVSWPFCVMTDLQHYRIASRSLHLSVDLILNLRCSAMQL